MSQLLSYDRQEIRFCNDASIDLTVVLLEFVLAAENGEFLALDLGGTNFRVIHVVINPSISSPEYHIKYHSVPESTRLGPGEHVSTCAILKMLWVVWQVVFPTLKEALSP